MDYNSGGGMNGDDLSGLGVWAYPGPPLTYGTHNSSPLRSPSQHPPTSSRSQQSYLASRGSNQGSFTEGLVARRPAPYIYTSPPAQNNAPCYVVPSTPPEVDPLRSYADVVARGRRSMANSASSASRQLQNYQYPTRTQPSQQVSDEQVGLWNTPQAQPQQGPSYAQVAARGQTHMSDPRQAYNSTAAHASFGQSSSSQQFSQQGTEQLMYSGPNASGYLGGAASENWPADATTNDHWTFDPNSDFSLYDDPMNRFLRQPTPFVAPGSLVINPSTPVAQSRLLMSPADSIDTSSMASSTRRSKAEIMGGNSGPFKCQHRAAGVVCTAGFNTPDDRRHHEYRVHLPYEARPFPCSKCDRRYIFRKDLTRHYRSKHCDRATYAKYFCDVSECKYAKEGFVRKDHFKRHCASHSKPDSAVQMSRSTSARTFS